MAKGQKRSSNKSDQMSETIMTLNYQYENQ